MRIDNEIIAGKTAVHRSLQMLGQRAFKPEALKKIGIGVDPGANLDQGLALF